MAARFLRPVNVSCFFCLSKIIPAPQNSRSFRCPHCNCWNRYDANGEISSDEPAMHEETMNTKSFAKRASPSKDRLPPAYGSGPFCHTCQTNQMLLMNLLSNYLPPPEDPEYQHRLEALPEYRNSLHLRYPPVCQNCFPVVEDEIKKKDHMARTRALGGWLKESKGRDKIRRVSAKDLPADKLAVEVLAWRIRGCLWVLTLVSAILGNSAGTFDLIFPLQLAILCPCFPALVLTSILWTVWDPTYASFRRAKIQGRDVRVQGKNAYIKLQMTAWFSRLLTATVVGLAWFRPSTLDYLSLLGDAPTFRSRVFFGVSLLLEISIFIASCFVLRLQHPPAIRLIDTHTHKLTSLRNTSIPLSNNRSRSATPFNPTEPDLLSTLSLSAKPVMNAQNPIFGIPSLLSGSMSTSVDDDGTYAMDWTPTDPSSSSTKNDKRRNMSDDDGAWLRPQRFFPPENPTGLESLFARTKIIDESDSHSRLPDPDQKFSHHVWDWRWVYLASLLPLAGIAWQAWRSNPALML